MTFVTDFRKFERFLPSCYRDGPGEVYGWQTTNVDKCNCSGALVYRLDVRGSPVLVEAFRGTPADKGTGYRVPVQLPTFGAKRPTFHPKALRHLWISAAELNDRDGTYTFCFGDHNDLPREFEIEVRRGTPFQHQTRLLHGDRLRTEERADNEKSRAVVWLDVYISPELFFDDYKYGDARTPEQIKADQEASVSIVLGGDVAEAILRDHEDEFVVEDEEDEVEVDLFVYLDVARILWYCEKKSGPDDFAAVTDVTCEWKHCEIGEMDATHGEMSEMGGECVRSEFISAATILGVPIISSRVKKNARGTGLVPEVAATPPAQAQKHRMPSSPASKRKRESSGGLFDHHAVQSKSSIGSPLGKPPQPHGLLLADASPDRDDVGAFAAGAAEDEFGMLGGGESQGLSGPMVSDVSSRAPPLNRFPRTFCFDQADTIRDLNETAESMLGIVRRDGYLKFRGDTRDATAGFRVTDALRAPMMQFVCDPHGPFRLRGNAFKTTNTKYYAQHGINSVAEFAVADLLEDLVDPEQPAGLGKGEGDAAEGGEEVDAGAAVNGKVVKPSSGREPQAGEAGGFVKKTESEVNKLSEEDQLAYALALSAQAHDEGEVQNAVNNAAVPDVGAALDAADVDTDGAAAPEGKKKAGDQDGEDEAAKEKRKKQRPTTATLLKRMAWQMLEDGVQHVPTHVVIQVGGGERGWKGVVDVSKSEFHHLQEGDERVSGGVLPAFVDFKQEIDEIVDGEFVGRTANKSGAAASPAQEKQAQKAVNEKKAADGKKPGLGSKLDEYSKKKTIPAVPAAATASKKNIKNVPSYKAPAAADGSNELVHDFLDDDEDPAISARRQTVQAERNALRIRERALDKASKWQGVSACYAPRFADSIARANEKAEKYLTLEQRASENWGAAADVEQEFSQSGHDSMEVGSAQGSKSAGADANASPPSASRQGMDDNEDLLIPMEVDAVVPAGAAAAGSARNVAGEPLGGEIQESEQYGLDDDNEDGFELRNNRKDPLFAARPSRDWNPDFPLHDHQRRVLGWMIRRERVEDPHFRVRMERSLGIDAETDEKMTSDFYFHLRGGLLADKVGGGKTSTSLALIAYDSAAVGRVTEEQELGADAKAEDKKTADTKTSKGDKKKGGKAGAADTNKNSKSDAQSAKLKNPGGAKATPKAKATAPAPVNKKNDKQGAAAKPKAKAGGKKNPKKAESVDVDCDASLAPGSSNRKATSSFVERFATANKDFPKTTKPIPSVIPLTFPVPYKNSYFSATKTTVLFVPSHLLKQWVEEVRKFLPGWLQPEKGWKDTVWTMGGQIGSYDAKKNKVGKRITLVPNVNPLKEMTPQDVMDQDLLVCTIRLVASAPYQNRWKQIAEELLVGSKDDGKKFAKKEDAVADIRSKEEVGELIREYTRTKCMKADGKPKDEALQKTFPLLEQFFFRRVLLDEFHEVQELKEQEGRILCSIKGAYRWGLTGTPRTDTVSDVAYLASAFGMDLVPQPRLERDFFHVVHGLRSINDGRNHFSRPGKQSHRDVGALNFSTFELPGKGADPALASGEEGHVQKFEENYAEVGSSAAASASSSHQQTEQGREVLLRYKIVGHKKNNSVIESSTSRDEFLLSAVPDEEATKDMEWCGSSYIDCPAGVPPFWDPLLVDKEKNKQQGAGAAQRDDDDEMSEDPFNRDDDEELESSRVFSSCWRIPKHRELVELWRRNKFAPRTYGIVAPKQLRPPEKCAEVVTLLDVRKKICNCCGFDNSASLATSSATGSNAFVLQDDDPWIGDADSGSGHLQQLDLFDEEVGHMPPTKYAFRCERCGETNNGPELFAPVKVVIHEPERGLQLHGDYTQGAGDVGNEMNENDEDHETARPSTVTLYLPVPELYEKQRLSVLCKTHAWDRSPVFVDNAQRFLNTYVRQNTGTAAENIKLVSHIVPVKHTRIEKMFYWNKFRSLRNKHLQYLQAPALKDRSREMAKGERIAFGSDPLPESELSLREKLLHLCSHFATSRESRGLNACAETKRVTEEKRNGWRDNVRKVKMGLIQLELLRRMLGFGREDSTAAGSALAFYGLAQNKTCPGTSAAAGRVGKEKNQVQVVSNPVTEAGAIFNDGRDRFSLTVYRKLAEAVSVTTKKDRKVVLLRDSDSHRCAGVSELFLERLEALDGGRDANPATVDAELRAAKEEILAHTGMITKASAKKLIELLFADRLKPLSRGYTAAGKRRIGFEFPRSMQEKAFARFFAFVPDVPNQQTDELAADHEESKMKKNKDKPPKNRANMNLPEEGLEMTNDETEKSFGGWEFEIGDTVYLKEAEAVDYLQKGGAGPGAAGVVKERELAPWLKLGERKYFMQKFDVEFTQPSTNGPHVLPGIPHVQLQRRMPWVPFVATETIFCDLPTDPTDPVFGDKRETYSLPVPPVPQHPCFTKNFVTKNWHAEYVPEPSKRMLGTAADWWRVCLKQMEAALAEVVTAYAPYRFWTRQVESFLGKNWREKIESGDDHSAFLEEDNEEEDQLAEARMCAICLGEDLPLNMLAISKSSARYGAKNGLSTPLTKCAHTMCVECMQNFGPTFNCPTCRRHTVKAEMSILAGKLEEAQARAKGFAAERKKMEEELCEPVAKKQKVEAEKSSERLLPADDAGNEDKMMKSKKAKKQNKKKSRDKFEDEEDDDFLARDADVADLRLNRDNDPEEQSKVLALKDNAELQQQIQDEKCRKALARRGIVGDRAKDGDCFPRWSQDKSGLHKQLQTLVHTDWLVAHFETKLEANGGLWKKWDEEH
eukprot:g10228.t1